MLDLVVDDPDVAGHTDIDVDRSRRDRRRWIVAGGAAAAIGLVVAATLSGGGSTIQSLTPTSAPPASPSTTGSPVVPPIDVSEVASTTASSDEPTTSTTGVQLGSGRGPLLGEATGVTLTMIGDGTLKHLDLDTGVLVASSINVFADFVNMRRVTGGIVFTDSSGPAAMPRFLADGATAPMALAFVPPATLTADSFLQFMGEGPPGRYWLSRQEPSSNRFSVGYVDAPGAELTLVTNPVGAEFGAVPDGTGGLIFRAPGGVYRVAPGEDQVSRIGTGELIDAGDGHLLEVSCDEQLRCALVVHDLATNTTRRLPGDFNGADIRFGRAGGILSPDGTQAALVSSNGNNDQSLTIEVRNDNGAAVTWTVETPNGGCPFAGCSGAPTWSSDSHWLFGVRNRTSLWAWRPGLSEPRIVELPGQSVTAMVAVPTATAS